jgi:hypothetical protein
MTPLLFVLPAPAGLVAITALLALGFTSRWRTAAVLALCAVALHLQWAWTAFDAPGLGMAVAKTMVVWNAVAVLAAIPAAVLLRRALTLPPRSAVILAAATTAGWIVTILPLVAVWVSHLQSAAELEGRMRAAAAYAPVVALLLADHSPQEREQLNVQVIQPARCNAYGNLLAAAAPTLSPDHCRTP